MSKTNGKLQFSKIQMSYTIYCMIISQSFKWLKNLVKLKIPLAAFEYVILSVSWYPLKCKHSSQLFINEKAIIQTNLSLHNCQVWYIQCLNVTDEEIKQVHIYIIKGLQQILTVLTFVHHYTIYQKDNTVFK